MQAAHECRDAGEAARPAEAAAATATSQTQEFRDLFVSLVDPAGLLYTDKCIEIAGRMGDEASLSGYRAGARMASLLARTFADIDDIVSRSAAEGAMHYTFVACRSMIGVLLDTAEAYRAGKDAEPVAEIEELRRHVGRFRSESDIYRAELAAADPPGSGLSGLGMSYGDAICRDIVRKEQEKLREEFRRDGVDPIFPPKPGPMDEFFGEDDDPNISVVDILHEMRGRGPPEGYELVRVGDGARR